MSYQPYSICAPAGLGKITPYPTAPFVSPSMFGAKGDGATDDTLAIQKAINFLKNSNGGLLLIGANHIVTPQPGPGLSGTFGPDSICLDVSGCNNVSIDGKGTFKVKTGSTGSSGAVIANQDGAAISNFTIGRGVTIDGNRANTTGTISGIVICNGTQCAVSSAIQNSTFLAAQYAIGGLRNAFLGSMASNIASIAFQAQYPNGLVMLGNSVFNSGDNAFDISADQSTMEQIVISGNIADGCNSPCFVESGGNVTISDNRFTNHALGIYVNRITTQGGPAIIRGNSLQKGTGAAASGIEVNNNSGQCDITGNRFVGYASSIIANGSAEYLNIGTNTHDGITGQLIQISRAANALVKSFISQQIYESARRTNGTPFTASPISNAANFSNRTFAVNSFVPAWSLESGAAFAGTLAAEYVVKTSNLVQNPSWGNAYSIFFGGQTLVYITASLPAVGNYISINGTTFYISAQSGNQFTVQNPKGTDGDFTATTNGNYATTEYYPQWMEG